MMATKLSVEHIKKILQNMNMQYQAATNCILDISKSGNDYVLWAVNGHTTKTSLHKGTLREIYSFILGMNEFLNAPGVY